MSVLRMLLVSVDIGMGVRARWVRGGLGVRKAEEEVKRRSGTMEGGRREEEGMLPVEECEGDGQRGVKEEWNGG